MRRANDGQTSVHRRRSAFRSGSKRAVNYDSYDESRQILMKINFFLCLGFDVGTKKMKDHFNFDLS